VQPLTGGRSVAGAAVATVAAVVLGGLVSGCSAPAGPSGAPASAPVASPAPTPSAAAPSASPAGLSSPSVSPTGPTAAVELPGPGWTAASIVDPPLAYALPPYWQQLRLRDFRADLAAALGQTQGEVRDELAYILDLVDDGRMRSVAIGPSSMADFTSTLFVFVEEGDPDLESAAARRLAEQEEHLAGRTLVGRDPVGLGAGRAIRLLVHADPTGVPIQSVEYVIRAADGRTLAIVGTGPRDEPPFADFMRGVAESLVVGEAS
jgi:hypothetical protein